METGDDSANDYRIDTAGAAGIPDVGEGVTVGGNLSGCNSIESIFDNLLKDEFGN